MSTRGTVKFYKKINENEYKHLISIYNHWDSYPSGLGVKIKYFFDNISVVNGFGMGAKIFEVANGYDDLILQFIIWLKDNEVGNVYLADEHSSEEYNYKIFMDFENTKIDKIVVNDDWEDGNIFEGSFEEFGKWVEPQN